jgi:membrane-associated protease RseP (regulator of RpoE activity)
MVYTFILANLDYFLMILLGLILLIVILKNKKRVELQKLLFPLLYIVMYKTSWGLKKMNSTAKKLMKIRGPLSYTSITIGFVGMVLMTVLFVKESLAVFFADQPAPVGLLLPGADLPGLPDLSFMTWIIVIFVLATVHEFMHGVVGRMYDIPIKSSGFAIMGIVLPFIPAAFVEPDEKKVVKKSTKAQLAMLSAGPFANFITAIVFALILGFIISPAALAITHGTGVGVIQIEEGGPADLAGLQVGNQIISIDGNAVNNLDDFITYLELTTPFQKITVDTLDSTYSVTLGEQEGREAGYMGIGVAPSAAELKPEVADKYGTFFPNLLLLLVPLFTWIYLGNLFVGLFNLLPIWIVDGGRMFFLALKSITKNEKLSMWIWNVVSIILLGLVLFFIVPALFNYFIAPFVG